MKYGNAMPPAREHRTAGVCRVCGCTAERACVISPGFEAPARLEGDPMPVAGTMYVPPMACSWVEPDLCSRCHGPRRPTRRQACELTRLRAYKGPLRVRRGDLVGTLRVTMPQQGLTVTLLPGGRAVR